MRAHMIIGAMALGVYAWRLEDPKGSYIVFFDISNWLTSWVLTDAGVEGILRNFVSLILVDQADGFLLGLACFALLSLLFWPVRKAGHWCTRGMRRLIHRKSASQSSNLRELST